MQKAIVNSSIAVLAIAGVIFYFVNRSRNRKQDNFTLGKDSIKYIGERTHNSLHEIL